MFDLDGNSQLDQDEFSALMELLKVRIMAFDCGFLVKPFRKRRHFCVLGSFFAVRELLTKNRLSDH